MIFLAEFGITGTYDGSAIERGLQQLDQSIQKVASSMQDIKAPNINTSQMEQALSKVNWAPPQFKTPEFDLRAAEAAGMNYGSAFSSGTAKSIQSALSDPMGFAKNSITGMAEALGPVGIAAAAVATSFTAIGVASVNVASTFEDSMSRVQALTGEATIGLSDLAKTASKTRTYTEAGTAMEQLAQQGMHVKDMASALPAALTLAGATGQDTAQTTDELTNALKQFQLGSDQSTHVINTMVAASQQGRTSVVELDSAMRVAGPEANAMGVSFDQAAAAISRMTGAGISSRSAGSAFAAFLNQLDKPSKDMATGLSEIGVSTDMVSPKLHSFDEIINTLEEHNLTATKSVELFGATAGPGIAAMLGQGRGSFDAYTASISNTNAATKAAAAASDNATGNMKKLDVVVQRMEADIGTALLPFYTEWSKDLLDTASAALKLGEALAGIVPAAVKGGDWVSTQLHSVGLGYNEMADPNSEIGKTLAKAQKYSNSTADAMRLGLDISTPNWSTASDLQSEQAGEQASKSFLNGMTNPMNIGVSKIFSDAYLKSSGIAAKAGSDSGKAWADAFEANVKAGVNPEAAVIEASYQTGQKVTNIGGSWNTSSEYNALGMIANHTADTIDPAKQNAQGMLSDVLGDRITWQEFSQEGKDSWVTIFEAGKEIATRKAAGIFNPLTNALEKGVGDEFKTIVNSWPNAIKTHTAGISKEISDIISSGVTNWDDKGKLNTILEDLKYTFDEVPIAFRPDINKLMDEVKAAVATTPITLAIDKEQLAIDFNSYIQQNADLYKKEYQPIEGKANPRIIATATSENAYYQMLQQMQNSVNPRDQQTAKTLEKIDSILSKGDIEELGQLPHMVKEAILTNPELAKQTGFQQRMQLADIEISSQSKYQNGQLSIMQSDASKTKDSSALTSFYVGDLVNYWKSGGMKGIVAGSVYQVNAYGLSQAKAPTDLYSLSTFFKNSGLLSGGNYSNPGMVSYNAPLVGQEYSDKFFQSLIKTTQPAATKVQDVETGFADHIKTVDDNIKIFGTNTKDLGPISESFGKNVTSIGKHFEAIDPTIINVNTALASLGQGVGDALAAVYSAIATRSYAAAGIPTQQLNFKPDNSAQDPGFFKKQTVASQYTNLLTPGFLDEVKKYVPHAQTGAVVSQPTLLYAGEAGKEIIIPVEALKGLYPKSIPFANADSIGYIMNEQWFKDWAPKITAPTSYRWSQYPQPGQVQELHQEAIQTAWLSENQPNTRDFYSGQIRAAQLASIGNSQVQPWFARGMQDQPAWWTKAATALSPQYTSNGAAQKGGTVPVIGADTGISATQSGQAVAVANARGITVAQAWDFLYGTNFTEGCISTNKPDEALKFTPSASLLSEAGRKWGKESTDAWNQLYGESFTEGCIGTNTPDSLLKYTPSASMLEETARIQGGAWGSQLTTPPNVSGGSTSSPATSPPAQQDPGYNRLFPALQMIQSHTEKSAQVGIAQATKTTLNTQKIADNTAKLYESQGILTKQLSFTVLPSSNAKTGFFGDVGTPNDALVTGLAKNGYVIQYDPRTDTCEGLPFNPPDPSLKTTDLFYAGPRAGSLVNESYDQGYGWGGKTATFDYAHATPAQTAEYNNWKAAGGAAGQQSGGGASDGSDGMDQLAKIGETGNQIAAKTTTTLQEMSNHGWSVARAQSVVKQSDALAAKGVALSTAQKQLLDASEIYLNSIDTGVAILAHGSYVDTSGNLVTPGSGGGSGGGGGDGRWAGPVGGGWGNNPGVTPSGTPANPTPAFMYEAEPGFNWAEGGLVDQPTFGVFGEAGREAFVPISDRAAGLRILPQVMKELGVRTFSNGGIVGKMSASVQALGTRIINVYPAPGMNVDQLVEKVVLEIDRLENGKGF